MTWGEVRKLKAKGEPSESIAQELKRMNDNMCQNHAQEKAEKSKDRRFQLLNSIISAVLGGLITLFVEHFNEITSFFLK